VAFVALVSALFGCGSTVTPEGSGGAGGDGATATASTATGLTSVVSGSTSTVGTSTSTGSGIDKAANCTSTFGTALTSAFGRLDGTVLAVVKPTDTQCAMFNGDHVVLEVTMNGAVYRLVINVQSTVGDPKVQYLALDHAMPAPVWSEGWHTGLMLDYIADFGVHGPDFTPYAMADLSNAIADAMTIGQKVSVYSQSSGGASAHQIHRNDGKIDGAIVLDPDSATPKALLFHFADQTF
jgi:hypothetical protein